MAEAWQSAWVEVLPDFKDFKSKADKEMTSTLGRAGDSGGRRAGKNMSGGILGGFKGLGGPIVGAVAALGIGKLIGDAIGAGIKFGIDGVALASSLAETKSAINQVFGTAGADIIGFADTANQALGQTRLQALEAAQNFGVFGSAAGLTGKPLSDFSTGLVTLATDMASFYNTDSQTAIDALGAGLRGEAEPLRRFGVLMDDATLKAQALKLGIFDGTGSLTAQQRVLAAQAVIFQQTGIAQGDFGRTSEGLAGQQKILTASIEDSKAKLGESLLPALSTLATFANETLVPALDGVVEKVGPILAAALEEATPAIAQAAEDLAPFVEDLIVAASDGIPGFIEGMKGIAKELPEALQFFRDLADASDKVVTFLNILADPEANGSRAIYDWLAPGREGVKNFVEDLKTESNFLPKNMDTAGYEAGLGLARGLTSQRGNVARAARDLANQVTESTRFALQIKSPSRVMAALGAYTGEGFALGLTGSKSGVDKAMRDLVSIPDITSPVGRLGLAAAGSRGSGATVNQTINAVEGQSAAEIAAIARNDLSSTMRSLV